MSTRTSLLLLLLCACGSTPAPVEDGGSGGGSAAAGGGSAATGGGSEATGGGTTVDAGNKWDAVHAHLRAAALDAGVGEMALSVWDSNDALRDELGLGTFTPDTRVAIASASKMVSGAVIFELIRQGKLSLSSTTGDVLGWTGPKAAITLEHLLSFTSGLNPSNVCTYQSNTTLADCVENISQSVLVAPPGTRFDYGSTHLAVAGRMAEVATGKSWKELFDTIVGTPLGYGPDVAYFTAPRAGMGTTNPLLAGGLRMTANEYGKLLSVVFHKGTVGGVTIGAPALYDAQAKEPFPTVTIGSSPAAKLNVDWRYGYTAWLECPTPATGCQVIGSPGAFGFTPWADRANGYYAILSMQFDRDIEGGIVGFAAELQIELQPLIVEALK